MKASILIPVLLALAAAVLAAPLDKIHPVYESPAPPAPSSEIDRIVFARLAALGIQPVLCSDAVFIRRVYLDVTGTLPTAEEVRAFLQNPDAQNKRRDLIDMLLERGEYADYWAMKWGDVLRIKAEFPVNLWPNAAQAYHRWVRTAIAENMPYDRFARELLTSSGSNFRVGPVNFYRAVQSKTPETIASAVALTFLGARTDTWPADRLKGMAVFFSQVGYKPTGEWKEEIVFWDPLKSSMYAGSVAPGQDAIRVSDKAIAAAKEAAQQKENEKGKAKEREKGPEVVPPPVDPGPLAAVFPDGKTVTIPRGKDPREVFTDWLLAPGNPGFARCIANRTWAWLMGRGIIHEPDDIRPGNAPSLPELMACLEKDLVAGRYDLKRLLRMILNSGTYQLTSRSRLRSPEVEGAFAYYTLRRLEAEVLIDAINRITGTTDLYTSPIPEPFTNIPQDVPAVAIADGSITSPFLALFGRSARATGMMNERDDRALPAQWLHLLNSSHIQQKLEKSPRLKALLDGGRKPREILEGLYLTILSRLPTDEEIRIAEDYQAAGVAPAAVKPPAGRSGKAGVTKRREEWLDIAWALLNSSEFLYRH